MFSETQRVRGIKVGLRLLDPSPSPVPSLHRIGTTRGIHDKPPGPRPIVCHPSSLLEIDGKVGSYTLPSSDASVPGEALLLLEDGRGADDSLAERHNRLVKGGHHYVARKESDNPQRFVAYITQPVWHHGRNYRH